ncbi:MAG: DNA polymerase III subunit gamma/tau [Balneolaceae bacterium]|nr:DNA polymerase III subunit gamma/tau [Balneolaceae bacterium]MBO6545759.1 DNA polymerase III subunit gamma/tau [Balneolaceae bacterium]MBO6647155.1 DNA polymerase III subunit gamma/tau [Balneolaceae bacterium]
MPDTYRALTRKYRPNSFEDIVSQDHVSNTLLNAIKQNRLSHAYMFCGPRGVGKTTMARVLARVINKIDANVDGEALNQTMSITEMDAASNNKVEDVHHLREIVRIPPQNSLYKVIIVDEVHMLSKAAFNALLKTLEEPPEHVIFIFATTEPHKVLPTILSRVQRFDFKRIAVEEIVHRLRKISLDENISIDDESLHVIAKKADGALRDALGLMDQAIAFCGDTITHSELLQALNVVGTDRLFEFMSCVKEHDADKGLELINTLLQEGYDIQEFLIGLTEHLRNLYIAHHSEKMYLVEASEETKAKYKNTASHFSRDDLMRMLHLVSEAQIKLKDAHQPRIQFEITLLKLIHMERTENLVKLLSELDDLKKNSRNLAVQEETKLQSDKDAQEFSGVKQENKGETEAIESAAVKESEPLPPETDSQPEIMAKVNSEPIEEVVPEPVHDEYDLGQPALVTEVTQKAKVLHFPNGNRTPKPAPVPIETKEETPAKKLLVEDVKAVWDEFVTSLENNIPKVLELQVQRIQPSKLKGVELTLECDNAFAKKMLDEQAHDLSLRLKEHIGTMLRFRTEVKKREGAASTAKNPYERFKEIQQKDPIIRDLVERFGAELEY